MEMQAKLVFYSKHQFKWTDSKQCWISFSYFRQPILAFSDNKKINPWHITLSWSMWHVGYPQHVLLTREAKGQKWGIRSTQTYNTISLSLDRTVKAITEKAILHPTAESWHLLLNSFPWIASTSEGKVIHHELSGYSLRWHESRARTHTHVITFTFICRYDVIIFKSRLETIQKQYLVSVFSLISLCFVVQPSVCT